MVEHDEYDGYHLNCMCSYCKPTTEKMTKPQLGCATTRELLAEIKARIEVDGQLDYRTIDGD